MGDETALSRAFPLFRLDSAAIIRRLLGWAFEPIFYLCVVLRDSMIALEPLLESTVGGLGYRLADFDYSNHGRMLRVFIEKEHQPGAAGIAEGVTLSDCEAVSRQLQRVLEVEGVRYDRLEVSSPGLDRRLKKAADFARFTGHEAEVRLRQPVNGRRNFTGVVRAVEGDRVEFDFDEGRLAFQLADLDRARLVPKL
jgi:ribosome maturation factor RimP